MRTPEADLIRVALGVAGLFGIATVLIVVWGVMQRQALDEERVAQADLREQLAAYQSSPPMGSQPVDPSLETAPSTPSAVLPDTKTPSTISGSYRDPAGDPFWTLSGDVATDRELIELAAERCARSQSSYDEINLSPEKRVALDKLLLRFYAKQMLVGRQTEGDSIGMSKGLTALHKYLDVEMKKIMTPREFAAWEELGTAKIRKVLSEDYNNRIDMYARSMSPSTREHVVNVFIEEHFSGHKKVSKYMPDEEDGYVRGIAAQAETLRCVRERLAPSLSPEDLEGLDRILDDMSASISGFGDMVAESMDKQQSNP